jgi:hypothetical protein
MLKITGHDDAILGPAMIWGTMDKKGGGIRTNVLVYDAEAIRATLMTRDGMDAEEAREYIEFNIEGAYMGPDTPILVWLEDLWDEDYDE